jgi:tetratricopeptide (TPR) repeat protein
MRPKPWDYSPTSLGEFGARCIIAGRVIWFYVGKLLFPFPLLFSYGRWSIDPANLVGYLFPLAALVVVGATVAARAKIGRGPVVAVLYFVGTLFPALGFVNVWPMQYSFVADHFVYLSSIGLIALAAAVLVKYVKFEVVAGVAAVVLLVFMGKTFSYANVFHDPMTLWADTWMGSGKRSWIAANNIGVIYFDQYREQGEREPNLIYWAEEMFKGAQRRNPENPHPYLNLAKVSAARAGAAEKARAGSTTAATTSTTSASTLLNQYHQQAIDYAMESLRVDPNFAHGHFLLGQLHQIGGRNDLAAEEFRKAADLVPPHAGAFRAEIYEALGAMAQQENDRNKAIAYFYRAAESDPDSVSARSALGTALLQEGKIMEGLSAWQDAMLLDPGNWRLPVEFGARLASAGEYGRAISALQQALRLNRQSVEALTLLGIVAAKTGFVKEARDKFEEALKIDPTYAKARESFEALEAGRLAPATTRSSTAPSTTRAS